MRPRLPVERRSQTAILMRVPVQDGDQLKWASSLNRPLMNIWQQEAERGSSRVVRLVERVDVSKVQQQMRCDKVTERDW